ncbi:MAG: recN [Hydrocarboniphaga sp.]|uniref:DNA repair protein RecN n=1 Tax=Hydrocarboniphaga sp. TaxID=2033016 RepID=UPI00261C2D3B|nr:DNA repair protein RecN [Hydrocarboniphaga sp.]MDB5970693.1 recN [Hydrocarboniphaga sp.]
MLLGLSIKNLAIIDALDLEFGRGFTVLTGETGAGKSILIDAIGLAIGTRAEAALVRSGQERAEISAEFSLSDAPAARAWLQDQEMLDADDTNACVLRRVVYAEGRTRAFVNNAPVAASALRELGETLIEVFGQNQSQTLVRADTQRSLLDSYGEHARELAQTAELAQRWSLLGAQIEKLGKASTRDPAQLEFLRYQIRELDALNLQPGELEQLDIDHRRLANAGRLLEDGGRALELLYGGESSAYDQLSSANLLLASLSAIDAGFADIESSVGAAQSQLREATQALQRLLDRLDLDPAQLQQVEQRLTDVHDMARKHRLRADDLPERLIALRAELDEAEAAAGGAEKLVKEQGEVETAWRAAAQQLSAQRRKAASQFSEQVTRGVRSLGMANAEFVVAVELDAGAAPRAHGADEVRFDFSANPGQPPRPIAKVASGGELSRLSLAIQVAGSNAGGAATMIFDEVDAGIGGGVAEIVGQQLRALGQDRQVLCVTHLAQVAAQGLSHHGIAKEVRAGSTYTRVMPLDQAQRVQELARMMGGVEITASTQAHAKELLERAGG